MCQHTDRIWYIWYCAYIWYCILYLLQYCYCLVLDSFVKYLQAHMLPTSLHGLFGVAVGLYLSHHVLPLLP